MMRSKSLIRSSIFGISLRSLIVGVELFGFVLLGSSALLLDALSAVFDIISSFLLLLFIKLASKPPDHDHPLGHGRYEPIAGLQLGIILAILGGIMGFEQGISFLKKTDHRIIPSLGWVIPLCALFLYEISYHVLSHAAKKQHSVALAVDAMHYRIDGISSFIALLALFLGSFYPHLSLFFDHLGALFIALFMISTGLYASRKNLHQLLDKTPEKKYFEMVRRAAMSIQEVRATEKIRLQIFGPDAQVSIDIEVDPFLCVEKAHEITQRVRREIQNTWPAVRDVIVHVEPHGKL